MTIVFVPEDKTADHSYVFLDESGNLDFGLSGTRYFVMTGVRMTRPFYLLESLDRLKHDRIEAGMDMEAFHCAEDEWATRMAAFDLIAEHLDELGIYCILVEKTALPRSLREAGRLYPWMLGQLLREVLPDEVKREISSVNILTDTIPVKKNRSTAEIGIKQLIAAYQPASISYRVSHYQSCSHYGLQVADYCSWAIYRRWQRGERTWYDIIKPAICSLSTVAQTQD